ncbi:hypothetical protein BWQ96_03129 [Gracilariopsis chorda]|uniref:Uncharacterized protein n=1 Tax=Gracilariopsis chorda TaxID=448386 RepID=A0A2V3IY26_9FLOR|nr:hypothetical protein BWQ96_03129 [Gracilariopsis chorda]|eukprot:PXF47052.1 hypothetical protein BWQ96_03129 [Gracilariopsis chorda]
MGSVLSRNRHFYTPIANDDSSDIFEEELTGTLPSPRAEKHGAHSMDDVLRPSLAEMANARQTVAEELAKPSSKPLQVFSTPLQDNKSKAIIVANMS